MLEIRIQPDFDGKVQAVVIEDRTGKSAKTPLCEKGVELETAIASAISAVQSPEVVPPSP